MDGEPSLRERNMRRLRALAEVGVPASTHSIILDLLVDRLLPAGTPERVEFDRALDEETARQLDELEPKVEAARRRGRVIPAGPSSPSGLIVPE